MNDNIISSKQSNGLKTNVIFRTLVQSFPYVENNGLNLKLTYLLIYMTVSKFHYFDNNVCDQKNRTQLVKIIMAQQLTLC